MNIKLIILLSLYLIWVSLVGIQSGTLAICFSLLIPVITLYIASKFSILPQKNKFNIKSFSYIIWMLKEIASSTISVIKIVWKRKISITPSIGYIKSLQTSNVGNVIYANSISLTPGTLTINIEDKKILIHALDKSFIDGMEYGEMDEKIKTIIN